MIRHIKDEKWKDFIKDFMENPHKWYKSQIDEDWEFDEEIQMKIIEDNLFNDKYNELSIKYIKNPTKQVCLEAVKRNGYAIQHIKNPTEEMCLEAVKRCGNTIKYIDNPTEEMQLEAVKQNGLSIKFIKNPTKEMCMEAIRQDELSINFIKNPTKDMYLEAVKQNGLVIFYIENPTEEMCLEAVKQNGLVIFYIENPTEEMCLEAVKQNGESIKFISKKNQSFDIIQTFFDYDWSKSKYNREDYYEYLAKKFITKDQAMIMIEDNPKYINLVSDEIQKELLEMKPELKKYLNKEEIEDINNDFFK